MPDDGVVLDYNAVLGSHNTVAEGERLKRETELVLKMRNSANLTQSDIDCELYCEMPKGFEIPGKCLLLHMSLEGSKVGHPRKTPVVNQGATKNSIHYERRLFYARELFLRRKIRITLVKTDMMVGGF